MAGVVSYRIATPQDSDEILEIYRPYIESTNITFETFVPAPREFRKRVEDILKQFPYVVAEGDGKIIGYAYAAPYRERLGYLWTVELSVYVRREYHSLGIGTHLYGRLLDLLRLQGYQNVCAVISWPNPESEKLHHHFGFRFAGLQKNCGFKKGQWCDVAIFERRLGDYPIPPTLPTPFPELPEEQVVRILKMS